MKQATRFAVQMSWKLLIVDMGYAPDDVLRLARLPGDLFARTGGASLSPAQYFDLWRGLEQAAGNDELALKLAQAMSVEAFDPAMFACLCSPDLNNALQRLAHYKRLICPLHNSRLSVLNAQANMRERVRAVLLETLPAGISSIDAVAQRLALSKRSLQRQLADESVGYQELLSEVRHELARHYLSRTDISAGEISLLLGFQESNSFIRAFRSWTGTTPAACRQGRVGLGSGVH